MWIHNRCDDMSDQEIIDSLGTARVAMLCGVSGSGKTRLARLLEAQGWVRLSTDAIVWREFGEEYLKLPEERQREVYRQANMSMMRMLPELLDKGKRVVIDSPMCKLAKREEVRRICTELDSGCVTVYLGAPEAVLLHRLAARSGVGPDDQKISPSELRQFLNGFEAPQSDEPHLEIFVKE